MSLNQQTPNFSKIKGHLLSVLIIGVVAISINAIVIEKTQNGLTGTDFDALMAFDMSAVAAMSWHAYSLAVSTSGLSVKQGTSDITPQGAKVN